MRLAWGHTARTPHLERRNPGSFSPLDAAGLETLITASLVLMIFFFTSHARTARWTPLGNLAARGYPCLARRALHRHEPQPSSHHLAGPARSPPRQFLVYVAGPSAGALLAAAVFAAFRRTNTLTAKLFHGPQYPSTVASALPTAIP